MGEETVISEGAATAFRVKMSVSRQKAVGKKCPISPSLLWFLECMELCWLGWLRDPALCMPSL